MEKNKQIRKRTTVTQQRMLTNTLHQLASAYVSRAQLQASLGKTFGGNRNLYQACGYKTNLEYVDYRQRYDRQDIARRVVNAYPDATWRGDPQIIEDDDPKVTTAFEKSWQELLDQLNVFHYLHRIDRLAGIGSYGVLLVGFDDKEDLSTPVKTAKRVLYLQPYDEDQAAIDSTVSDTKDPRYGLPEIYTITRESATSSSGSTQTSTIRVHWSRVLHVAEGTLDSDVFGTPRLQAVYNRLEDLEKILGGSAEMFWQAGFPGYALEADPDLEFDQNLSALNDQIEKYMHGLSRYMRLQGIKVNTLSQQVSDPNQHVAVQIQMISAETGIPQRILLGSERGELASSQDKEGWEAHVDERRRNFATPSILRPFIDMLVRTKVLAAPKKNDYDIVWPEVDMLSEKDKAEIANVNTRSISEYVKSGADVLIPPFEYLTMVLGMDEDEAEAIVDELEKIAMEEEQEQVDNPPPGFPPQDGDTMPEQDVPPQNVPPGTEEEGAA